VDLPAVDSPGGVLQADPGRPSRRGNGLPDPLRENLPGRPVGTALLGGRNDLP